MASQSLLVFVLLSNFLTPINLSWANGRSCDELFTLAISKEKYSTSTDLATSETLKKLGYSEEVIQRVAATRPDLIEKILLMAKESPSQSEAVTLYRGFMGKFTDFDQNYRDYLTVPVKKDSSEKLIFFSAKIYEAAQYAYVRRNGLFHGWSEGETHFYVIEVQLPRFLVASYGPYPVLISSVLQNYSPFIGRVGLFDSRLIVNGEPSGQIVWFGIDNLPIEGVLPKEMLPADLGVVFIKSLNKFGVLQTEAQNGKLLVKMEKGAKTVEVDANDILWDFQVPK